MNTIKAEFDKISGFEFSKTDYEIMLSEFKKHYLIEKTNWEKRNPEFKQKLPFEK